MVDIICVGIRKVGVPEIYIYSTLSETRDIDLSGGGFCLTIKT